MQGARSGRTKSLIVTANLLLSSASSAFLLRCPSSSCRSIASRSSTWGAGRAGTVGMATTTTTSSSSSKPKVTFVTGNAKKLEVRELGHTKILVLKPQTHEGTNGDGPLEAN